MFLCLFLVSFPRYSHTVGEGWVNGQSSPLKAVVVLISRRVVIQGNVTMERMSHLRHCTQAGDARGEVIFSHRKVLRRKTAPLKSHCGITVY